MFEENKENIKSTYIIEKINNLYYLVFIIIANL